MPLKNHLQLCTPRCSLRNSSCCDKGRRSVRGHAKRGLEQAETKDADLTLNPVELGRRSRQAINEAWMQVTRLSTPRASFTIDDDLGAGFGSNIETPQAPFTKVLVVGGTGRVGRILVRKLLLRGYPVRVLCRGTDPENLSMLPSSVEIVKGDVGNLQDCVRATRGMDKIIYCATSQLNLTGDINRVDNIGVSNISRAWMDGKHTRAQRNKTKTQSTKRTVAKFGKTESQESWNLLHVGPTDREFGYHGQDFANAMISEDMKRLIFQGSIFSRSGICEWGGPCGDLTNCEALVARVLGDGKPYFAILEDEDGNTYSQRFGTRLGYSTVWLPFNRFRAESTASPPMRPGMLTKVKFRFDKSLIPADLALSASVEDEQSVRNAFSFEISWLKAQPIRSEPTFVLVSSASAAPPPSPRAASASVDLRSPGSTATAETQRNVNARRVQLKRRGETALRASGVGYCIVRPSTLVQEPGGYKALVFDQGDRIQQGIGYADVADVCLRSLHASEAVNKTFEVCYESVSDSSSMEYELVAHMPDKANNFLKTALADLEKNT